MNKLKYAVILLLGLSMVSMITSCKKDNTQLIVGKWEVIHHSSKVTETFDPASITPSMYDNHEVGDVWEFSSDGVLTMDGERMPYTIQGDILTIQYMFSINFNIYELTNSSLKIWCYFWGEGEYYEFKRTNGNGSNNGGNNGGGNNGGGNNGGGGGNSTYDGHEYVDLGLPSGTLWATCNVGADTPEGYGDYFAWGETTPKTNYVWSTYKYCNGSKDQLTKYCNNAYFGYDDFADNLTVLLPEDDAATSNWGSGWCMPTKEQWEELSNYTECTIVTQNGVKGTLVKASNGNSLFLPAAGFYYNDQLTLAGSNGDYWLSSLADDSPNHACGIYFNLGINDLKSDRSSGNSVRPVRSTNNNGETYIIAFSVNPTNGGMVTGAGFYQYGECCTLTATANSGYTFTNWTENGIVVSTQANYSFGVTTNRTLVANFTPIPLAVTDFEWYRQGTTQTGLDYYGLYWEKNTKYVHAHIKPLDGVTLYSFDSSAWNTTITDDDKVILFSNSTNTIEVYNNVCVDYFNSFYDDVIGTKMADGTLHLIHVTSCTSSSSPGGVICTIHGQSK